MEDGLGLATIASLLAVIAALSLDIEGRLARLVLRDLVDRVLLALATAAGATSLGNVYLSREKSST